MPSSSGYKRNYRQEYDRYHSSDEQKKKRAKRNAARSAMAKAGKVKKVMARMSITRTVMLKITKDLT